MDFNTTISYDFLPEEGGSVFRDRPNKKQPARKNTGQGNTQTTAKTARKTPSKPVTEPEKPAKEKFDAKKMVIYSEIMNPKFKE